MRRVVAFSTFAVALVAGLVVLVATPLVGPTIAGGVSAPATLAVDPTPAPGAPPATPREPGVYLPSPAPAGRPAAGFAASEAGADPTALALSWTATSDLTFTQYTVFESTNGSGGPYSSVAVVTSQSTTSYVDTGLTPGATTWWEVSEIGWLSGTQTTAPIEVIQPTLADLTDKMLSGSSLQFNWTNNASYGGPIGFVSYVLYEQVGTNPATPVAAQANETNQSAVITGLAGGTSYLFHLVTTDCTAGCGGSGATTTATASNPVTYGTPLPLAISLTATRTVVDTGQADLFLCAPSGGRSPFTYAWNFGNGTYVRLPASASQAFALPGTATITCRVTDSGGTQVSAATSVEVNLAPSLTVQLNRTAVDVGQSVSFGCTPGNGTPAFSIVWAFGDGAESSGGFQTHSYASAASLAATCTASDATGTTVTATQRVTVSPAPGVTVRVNAAYAAPGTRLVFQASASNGSGGFSTPTWRFSDGGTASGSPVSHAFGTGNFTATASSIDTNGATASGSVTVHVTPIALVLGSVPTHVPLHALVNFSASASGGAGAPYNFTWAFSDGSVAYGALVTHRFNASESVNATLQVRDALGAYANTTTPSIAVVAPPAPPPSYTLYYVVAAVIALLLLGLLLGVVIRRRQVEARLAGQLGRIPPTDPREIRGRVKVCARCGAPNRGLRGTCSNCGAPL